MHDGNLVCPIFRDGNITCSASPDLPHPTCRKSSSECLLEIHKRLSAGNVRQDAAFRALEHLLDVSKDSGRLSNDEKEALVADLRVIEDILSRLGKSGIFLSVGDAFFNMEVFNDALASYHRGIAISPKDKVIWNNAGVALVRMGSLKKSLLYYKKSLKPDKRYGNAWFNMGKALNKMDSSKKALKCFQKATEYEPGNKSAWNNRGVLLRRFGKLEEALRSYDRAIDIKRDYEWAWHNRGIVLIDLKRFKEAVRCFDTALEINPDYSPAREAKNTLLRAMNKTGTARV